MADVEKAPSPIAESIDPSPPASQKINLEEEGERYGYALDTSALENGKNIQLAKDGRTVLIPQPSDDPFDPLNWSYFKKHLIVFVISACAFLPDYGSATGGVVLIKQSG